MSSTENTAALSPESAPCKKPLTDCRSGAGRAYSIALRLRALWRVAMQNKHEIKCHNAIEIVDLLDELAGLDIRR